jgi:hypothetical protein
MKLQVCTSKRDIGLWERAVELSDGVGAWVTTDQEDLDADVVVIDDGVRPDVGQKHAIVLTIGIHPEVSGDGYTPILSGTLEVERFGALSMARPMVTLWGREDGPWTPSNVDLPKPTHGPGAPMALWERGPFLGLGKMVSRDDSDVMAYRARSFQGEGPMVVQPGFPFLVPVQPHVFHTLHGSKVEGMLCASLDNPGGFCVLTCEDVLRLIGHPGQVPWDQLQNLIGVQAGAQLLRWLARIAVNRLPS